MGEIVLHKLGYKIGFNVTDSMPLGIYILSNKTEKISTGDIVAFCLRKETYKLFFSRGYFSTQHGSCVDGFPAFIKKVIAQKGDLVEIKNNKVYVNSTEINHSKIFDEDAKGRKLDHLPTGYSHTLQSNELFVYGVGNERSLDSRYIGLILKDKILYKAEMLYEVKHK